MIARRAHRLAQVQAWAEARPHYELRIGYTVIGFDCLTEEAFDALRHRIANEVRFERRIARQNRALRSGLRVAA